jgi:hypothetical protein
MLRLRVGVLLPEPDSEAGEEAHSGGVWFVSPLLRLLEVHGGTHIRKWQFLSTCPELRFRA